jgi:hypothetical protein
MKGVAMKAKQWTIVFAVAVSIAMLGAMSPAMAAPKCDRQCLVDLMQKYLGALVKHNPKSLPFADKVKFTENNDKGIETLEIGKGLWATASGGPTDFQIFAADPEGQAAACLVVMKENDKELMLGARIKLVNGKITEAEHLVVRGGGSMPMNFSQPILQKARPGFSEDVPKAEQMKREDLIKIGLSYYDALTGEDGTLAPFAKECERHENGMVTAGGAPVAAKAPMGGMPTGGVGGLSRDCTEQISSGVFSYITEINPRRLVIADVQKGLAVGFSMFRHDGTRRPPKSGSATPANSKGYGQFNLAAMHVYKIRNGKLYEIEAPGAILPYGTKSGWE